MPDEIAALAADLAAPEAGARVQAAQRLAAAGRRALPALIPLVQACGDVDEAVREWAVAALEDIGAPAPHALADLIHLADADADVDADADAEAVAYWAVTLIGRLGAAATAGVPALARVVHNDRPRAIQQRAAWALGRVGPSAKSALSVLEAASSSPDPRLARLARQAIAKITAEAGQR